MQNEPASTLSITEEQFNIDAAVETLYTSALEFIIELHDYNNLTKKDVSNIQSGIIKSLLTPMVFVLKSVVKTREPLSLLKFDHVITAITNPFQF